MKHKVYKPLVKSTTSKVVQRQESSKEEQLSISKSKVSDRRRIEFECPECKCLFASYFSASKHIKGHHRPISDGNKRKRSVKLPMPVKLEICVKCNLRIGSDSHICHEVLPTLGTESVLANICIGCNQKFPTIQLFDMHVARHHTDDGVESLFLPHMKEFVTWKDHIEGLLSIRYLLLGKYTLKQTFHCTFLNTAEAQSGVEETRMCPSSIIVQEFPKGIQVHYYKKHYGHPCPEFTLSENYKKYSIASLMKQPTGYYKNITNVESDKKELYKQFKTLMENIVEEAAKIKIGSLKIIMDRAFEMTSLLSNNDEDDETKSYPNNKTLTDDQIGIASEKVRSKKRKYDSTINKKVVKKAKSSNNDLVSPKAVTAILDSETNNVNKGIKEASRNYDLKLNKKVTRINTPPSFNDSYKDFVNKKNINTEEDKSKAITPRSVQTRNTVAIRTYEGRKLRRSRAEREDISKEVSVKPTEAAITPKELLNITGDVLSKSKEVPIKLISNINVPSEIKKGKVKLNEIPVETKEVLIKAKVPSIIKASVIKSKEGSNVKIKEVPVKAKEVSGKTKSIKPKKNIVNTKIRQFKPSRSQKKKGVYTLSIDKLKPGFDYEVREQENDCNVLILKI